MASSPMNEPGLAGAETNEDAERFVPLDPSR